MPPDGPWAKYAAPADDQTTAPASAPTAEGPWTSYQSTDATPTPQHTWETVAPNGKRVRFEASPDASDSEILAAAAKAVGDKRYLKSYVDRKTGKPVQTDTSAVTGLMQGFEKPINKLADWVAATPVGKAINQASSAVGLPTSDEANAQGRAALANNTRTGYQALGDIAGTALVTSRLPGGALAQGAAGGAVNSDSNTASGVGLDAGLGALGGYVGGKIVSGIGSAIKGVTDPALRALNEAGVPLTIGQLASKGSGLISGAISKGEEALTSVPLLGDIINSARDRGVKALNVGVGNKILGNVGEKLSSTATAGHDMIDAVESKLSNLYSALVPKLTGIMDGDFQKDLAAAKAVTDTLPDVRQKQLADIVQNVFKNRVAGPASGPSVLNGQALKDAESQLTKLYGKYKGAQGDEGVFADAIYGVRDALRNMVIRSNPQDAAELQGLNTAWAQLKQLRGAVKSGPDLTKATGVISPGGLLRQSVKAGYRDPLLEAGAEVLPNRTPDSGTARRGLYTLGALAAGGTGGAATVSPMIAAAPVAAIPYTQLGQRALNAAAFAPRSAAVSAAGTKLNQIGRYAPQVVAPLLISEKNK